MKKTDKKTKSFENEFVVLSELCSQSFDASLSIKNKNNVLLSVSSPNNKQKKYRIEVKATFNLGRKISKSKDFGDIVDTWVLNKDNESTDDNRIIYCFISIDQSKVQKGNIFYYVVPNKVVKGYLKAENKFLSGKKEKHFRLGIRGYEYKIPTPFAEDYQNNWKLIK